MTSTARRQVSVVSSNNSFQFGGTPYIIDHLIFIGIFALIFAMQNIKINYLQSFIPHPIPFFSFCIISSEYIFCPIGRLTGENFWVLILYLDKGFRISTWIQGIKAPSWLLFCGHTSGREPVCCWVPFLPFVCSLCMCVLCVCIANFVANCAKVPVTPSQQFCVNMLQYITWSPPIKSHCSFLLKFFFKGPGGEWLFPRFRNSVVSDSTELVCCY